jgi:hypothetical protein
MPQQVVIEDNEFLKMIARGHTSAYAIHKFMEKQAAAEANDNEKQQQRPLITYKNIGVRMLRLAKDGLIQEETDIMIVGIRSMHSRKDYKITIKGIEQLIFSTNIHKEDIKTIADYLDKYHPNERHHALGYGLMIRFADASSLLSEYLEYIKHPELKLVSSKKYDDLLTKLRDIERYEKHPRPKPQQEIEDIVSKPSKPSSRKKT